MALTTKREIALYQILETPWSIVHKQIRSDGLIAVDKQIQAATAAKTQINEYLETYIYPFPLVQAELEALIDAWIALGTNTDTISGGSIGSITGYDFNPNKDRSEIQKQVLIIVPCYRHHMQFLRQTDGCIEIIR
jgi:hypothetical protein